MDLEEFLEQCDMQAPGSIEILNSGGQNEHSTEINDDYGDRTVRFREDESS